MTSATGYCTAVNDEDRAALQAATRAVDDAPPRQPGRKGQARDARRARAELIREIALRYRGDRYPNRWNPIIGDIAEATGLHRTQVSKIVNGSDE